MQPDGRNDRTARLFGLFAEIAARLPVIAAKQLKWAAEDDGFRILHPLTVGKVFGEFATRMLADPPAIAWAQWAYASDLFTLGWRTAQELAAARPVPRLVEPAPADRRFKDPGWTDNPSAALALQVYLLTAAHLRRTAGAVGGLDPHRARQAAFFQRLWLNALSPSNAALLNPEVVRATLDSGGENLLRGLANLLEDIDRGGGGHVSLKLSDLEAFRLGETLAVTPGKVVLQNAMMQLLQYEPATDAVRRRPLLIVPPWINKFYVLDLRPQNSFIKWAVDQGHTVFVISWINPDETLAAATFERYLLDGPLAALAAIEQATGEREVNAVGYCIGGTLLAITLAYLAAKGDRRIVSATYFASLLDFSEVGELSVFIDEEQMALMERHMRRRGYLEAHHLADAFSLLRDNELIWSFVVRNYLLGRQPGAFDILYWNADSTHMPAAMHSFYLRNMYLDNRLRQPNGITLAGAGIALGAIGVPSYFLSTREDHIAPWATTYRGARLMGGPVRFVLGGSGHIAGVLNPPAAGKYAYWTNDRLDADAETWLAGAEKHDGSWWPDWDRWVSPFAGGRTAPRRPGGGGLAVLGDAPGSFVRTRRN